MAKQIDRIRGSVDLPLTPEGMQQAIDLGGKLAKAGGFDKLGASDRLRTQLTMHAIARQTGAEAHTDSRLRDMAYGMFEGMPSKEAIPHINQFIKEMPDDRIPGRGAQSTQNGESFNEYKQHLLTAVQEWQKYSLNHSQERDGLILNRRSIKTIQGWLAAGAKPSLEVDPEVATSFGEDTKPGSMFWLMHPGGLKEMQPEDAMKYNNKGLFLIRHGETPWNGKE